MAAACTNGGTRTGRYEPLGPEICEQDPYGCVVVPPRRPIHLGLLILFDSYSGDGAQNGVEFALDRRGSVRGHRVELVFEQDACGSPEQSFIKDTRVSGPSIVAVIGPICSGSVPAAARVLAARGITLISPRATAADLTDGLPFFLRTAYDDRVQGEAMADFVLNRLGVRSAATLRVDWSYSEGLERGFSERFAARGGLREFRTQIPLMPTSRIPSEYPQAIDQLRQRRPGFLYLPLPVIEANAIVRQVRQTEGLQRLYLGGGDEMDPVEFLNRARSAAEGILVTSPEPDVAAWFRRDLKTWAKRSGRYGVALRLARWVPATAFDAANLVLDAVEAVGIEEGGTLFVPRTSFRDHIRSTRGYLGASGTLSCDAKGDCNPRVPVIVKEISQGRFTPVWTWLPRKARQRESAVRVSR